MKIFNFFKKKNKGVVVTDTNVIINGIDIDKVLSECIDKLIKAIKEQNFEDVKSVKTKLWITRNELSTKNEQK